MKTPPGGCGSVTWESWQDTQDTSSACSVVFHLAVFQTEDCDLMNNKKQQNNTKTKCDKGLKVSKTAWGHQVTVFIVGGFHFSGTD